MRVEKRHRFRLYYEILAAMYNGMQGSNKLSATGVARKVNIAYDRFQKHLDRLVEIGMVESRELLVVTEKGVNYIEEYRRYEDFLRRMGLLKR